MKSKKNEDETEQPSFSNHNADKIIHSILKSTQSCWNKVNQLMLSWQAFADLHAKAASSGLREMLD